MNEQIDSILKDFHYAAAYAFWCDHVPGFAYLKKILAVETAANRVLLRKKIQALREDAPDPPAVVAEPAKKPEPQSFDELWKPLYKEANAHFSDLRHARSDKQRKELAYKVLDLMDQVSDLWAQKDYYLANKTLLKHVQPKVDALDAEQLSRRRNTLRTYISKAKKSPEKQAQIPEWEAEILTITNLLKNA